MYVSLRMPTRINKIPCLAPKPAEEEKGNAENIFYAREGRKSGERTAKDGKNTTKRELKISSNIIVNLSKHKCVKNCFKTKILSECIEYQNQLCTTHNRHI